jgi:hypothetical protein
MNEQYPDNLTGQHPLPSEEQSKLDHPDLLNQAIADSKAFINQCDRDGIGMQTVTDHRKRVEKFFNRLKAIGRM